MKAKRYLAYHFSHCNKLDEFSKIRFALKIPHRAMVDEVFRSL